MKRACCTVIILLLSLIAYGQQGYVLNLNNEATIVLPQKPQTDGNATDKVYTLNNGTCIYFVETIELKNEDYFGKINQYNLMSFYETYVKNVLKVTNGQLWTQKPVLIDNQNGLEFLYEPKNGNPYITRYHHLVLINSTLICYGVWFPDAKLDTHAEIKDGFFATFKAAGENHAPKSSGKTTFIPDISNITSTMIFGLAGVMAFIFLVIIGVAFLLKKKS